MQAGAAQAFIAFLRCEATQAEERAKSLRATAAAIEANNLIGDGRRKKRKRDSSTSHAGSAESPDDHNKTKQQRQQKSHTGYTLYIHENYEVMKKSHIGMPSKDLIAIMNREWNEISEDEKRIWSYRAEQMKDQNISVDSTIMEEISHATTTTTTLPADMEEQQIMNNHHKDHHENGGGGKKRAVTKKAASKYATV